MSDGVFGFVLFLIFAVLTVYMVSNEIKKAKEESYTERKKRMNEALTGSVLGKIKKNEGTYDKSRDDLNNFVDTNRDVLRKHGVIGSKSDGENQ
ncbi:hypothetical protein [Caudoviricetes sp.]|nr:hypothetical protein [Caudoviricetes sp.]UOF79135.1 hypothetical protein [Caudoviricetes sp.]